MMFKVETLAFIISVSRFGKCFHLDSLGVIFYLATTVIQRGFILFVICQTPAMSAAFLMYVRLTIGRRLRGAVFMTAAILVNVIAVSIQASNSVGFKFLWQFDHNGVFHLVQMIGILLLYFGLYTALKTMDNSKLEEKQGHPPNHPSPGFDFVAARASRDSSRPRPKGFTESGR